MGVGMNIIDTTSNMQTYGGDSIYINGEQRR